MQMHGGVDHPWLSGVSPKVGATMFHLQCDRRCRLGFEELKSTLTADATLVVVHERDGETMTASVMWTMASLDYDENRRRYLEALEPMRLTHWHEPIPNWVGEGMAA